MKNILIINGAEPYPFAEGRLNKTLVDSMTELLSKKYNIKTTIVNEGYSVEDEIKKFTWADIIIFQHPIFWFGLPGKFKTYIDQVYIYGIFFEGVENYGTGGLMKGKKYMLSTTWNSPLKAFQNEGNFFEGKSVDEALFHIHKTHQFCGFEPLKSFSCHNVIQNPEIDNYLKNLEIHLKDVFQI